MWKGRKARHNLVERKAERVNIHSRVVGIGIGAELLRAHVAHGAPKRALEDRQAALAVESRAKIAKDQPAILREEEIFRLDVAMDYAVNVQALEGTRQAGKPESHGRKIAFIAFPAGLEDQLLCGLSPVKLHCKEVVATRSPPLKDSGDARIQYPARKR